MSTLRMDRTEIIENDQRKAMTNKRREPGETMSRKVAFKKRMDDVNYQRELDAINRFEV